MFHIEIIAFSFETLREVSQRGADCRSCKLKSARFTVCCLRPLWETLWTPPASLNLPTKFTAAAPSSQPGQPAGIRLIRPGKGKRDKGILTQVNIGEMSTAPLLSRAEASGPAPSFPHRHRPHRARPKRSPGPEIPAPRQLRPATPPYSEVAAPPPLLRPPPQPRSVPTATAFSFYYKPAAIAQPPGATGGHRPGAPHAGSCSSSASEPPRSQAANAADWDYNSQEPLRREGR